MMVSLVVSRLLSAKLEGTSLTCDRSGGNELHVGSKSSSADTCAASILFMAWSKLSLPKLTPSI